MTTADSCFSLFEPHRCGIFFEVRVKSAKTVTPQKICCYTLIAVFSVQSIAVL